MCIEDPFELSHDLGRTVDPGTRQALRKEFERAALLLRDDPDPMPKLFEPYRSPGAEPAGQPAAKAAPGGKAPGAAAGGGAAAEPDRQQSTFVRNKPRPPSKKPPT